MSRIFETMSKDKTLTDFFKYKQEDCEEVEDGEITMTEPEVKRSSRSRSRRRSVPVETNISTYSNKPTEVTRDSIQTTLTYIEQKFPLDQQKNDDENDFVNHIRDVMNDYLYQKESKVTFTIGSELNYKHIEYTIVGTLQQRTSTVIMLFYEGLLEPIMLNQKKKIVIKFS